VLSVSTILFDFTLRHTLFAAWLTCRRKFYGAKIDNDGTTFPSLLQTELYRSMYIHLSASSTGSAASIGRSYTTTINLSGKTSNKVTVPNNLIAVVGELES